MVELNSPCIYSGHWSLNFKSRELSKIWRSPQRLKLICKSVQFLIGLRFYVPIPTTYQNQTKKFVLWKITSKDFTSFHTQIQLKANRQDFHFMPWWYNWYQLYLHTVKQVENRVKYVEELSLDIGQSQHRTLIPKRREINLGGQRKEQ